MRKRLNRIAALACAMMLPVTPLMWQGCASFHTTQTDVNSGTNHTTTTTVNANTFWSAKSELAKFRAFQSDKSQSATVGSLNLASSNNAVEILNAIANILKSMPTAP